MYTNKLDAVRTEGNASTLYSLGVRFGNNAHILVVS